MKSLVWLLQTRLVQAEVPKAKGKRLRQSSTLGLGSGSKGKAERLGTPKKARCFQAKVLGTAPIKQSILRIPTKALKGHCRKNQGTKIMLKARIDALMLRAGAHSRFYCGISPRRKLPRFTSQTVFVQ